MSTGDGERAERVLKRNILRRDVNVEDILDVYTLATRVKMDQLLVPLFIARKNDLEQSMADFTIEQDAIMDTLINLGRESEYIAIHAPISREVKKQYYFIHAICHELNNEKPVMQPVRANIHLPKITLPTFDGDILQWTTFRDKFKALIDSDNTLAPIEKFHYLAGCVIGRAAVVVNSLKMTNDNYSIVWEKLNDQFNNPRLSAKMLVDRILNFRKMENESTSGLMEYLQLFDECLQSLNVFNMGDLPGFILFVLANRTLFHTTRELFERDNKMDFPTIDDLVTFIKRRVKVLENVSIPSSKWVQKGRIANIQSKKASVLVAANDQEKIKCPLCKNNHDLKDCTKFLKMPASNRHMLVSSFRRCFRCLSSKHISSSCDSENMCNSCGEAHHSLLHFKKSHYKTSTISFENNASTSSSTDCGTSLDKDPLVIAAIGNMAPSMVVLGTALAHTRDQFGNTKILRILIDPGSQISVITESCARRLGLTIKKCTMAVSGLAGTSIP